MPMVACSMMTKSATNPSTIAGLAAMDNAIETRGERPDGKILAAFVSKQRLDLSQGS